MYVCVVNTSVIVGQGLWISVACPGPVFPAVNRHATNGRVSVIRSYSLFSIVSVELADREINKGTKIVTTRMGRIGVCHFC